MHPHACTHPHTRTHTHTHTHTHKHKHTHTHTHKHTQTQSHTITIGWQRALYSGKFRQDIKLANSALYVFGGEKFGKRSNDGKWILKIM